MRSPPIYVILRTNGDGWGHNTQQFVSWHFDQQEAQDHVNKLLAHGEGTWYSVEEVPPAEPIEKRSY